MPFPAQPVLYLYTSRLLDISIQRTYYHSHIPNHTLDTQSSLVSGLPHLLVAQARNLIFLFTHPHIYSHQQKQSSLFPEQIPILLPSLLHCSHPHSSYRDFSPTQTTAAFSLASLLPPLSPPSSLQTAASQTFTASSHSTPSLAFSALPYCGYKVQDHFQGLQELSPHFHSNPGPRPIPLDLPPASRPLHMLFPLSELPFVQLLIRDSFSTSPDYVFLVSLDPH